MLKLVIEQLFGFCSFVKIVLVSVLLLQFDVSESLSERVVIVVLPYVISGSEMFWRARTEVILFGVDIIFQSFSYSHGLFGLFWCRIIKVRELLVICVELHSLINRQI